MTPDRAASAGGVTEAELDRLRAEVERELGIIVDGVRHAAPEGLAAAIEYALLSPGKRIRPVLTLAAADCMGAPTGQLVRVAAAFELVHAYSLVHDDLPCMDDDDLRRGRPTCHVRFGESVALLVGDALQAEAFRVVAEAAHVPPERRTAVLALLARAAGPAGMVGGQFLDIEASGAQGNAGALREIHERKTGALIAASVEAGAVLGGATEAQRQAWALFGRELGLLFQQVDDLLDVAGDSARTGKPTGSDEALGKLTTVSQLGLAGARVAADAQLATCLAAAGALPGGGGMLPAIARYVRTRDR